MFFQGEQATKLEKTVLDIVEAVLDARFKSAAHAPTFQKFGGVAITRDPETGLTHFVKGKRPFLFIQLDGDEQHGWKKVLAGVTHEGTRHQLAISIEAITNAPCKDAESALKDALRDVLKRAYPTLRAAGLEGAKVRALKPEEAPDRRNSHLLTVTAYTL